MKWSSILVASQLLAADRAASGPATICYSTQPSPYFNDRAADIKRIYDGFFFTVKQDLKRPHIDLRDWHQLLVDKPVLKSSPLQPVLNKVRQFDRGRLSGEQLCDAFGTPGRWWVLGMVGNSHTQPQFAALEALQQPLNTHMPYQLPGPRRRAPLVLLRQPRSARGHQLCRRL